MDFHFVYVVQDNKCVCYIFKNIDLFLIGIKG